MADGIRTPNLPLTPLIDELLGNRDGQTSRIPLDDFSEYQRRSIHGIEHLRGRRCDLELLLTADHQPHFYDLKSPEDRRNAQLGYLQRVYDGIGRSLPNLHGMIIAGDFVHRANDSESQVRRMRMAGLDPDNQAKPGAEYIWGPSKLIRELTTRTGLSMDRVWIATGNHDISGRGLLTNPLSWTFDRFHKLTGSTHYYVICGNVGFYILGDEAGQTGGQISRKSIDQAYRVMKRHPQVAWHLVTHQPPVGYHPREVSSVEGMARPTILLRDTVTLTPEQVTEYETEGTVEVEVGSYENASPAETNLFLGGRNGILLEPYIDYLYQVDPGEADDLEDENDDDEHDQDEALAVAAVYNKITLLPGFARWNVDPADAVLQLVLSEARRTLDMWTTHYLIGTDAQPGLIKEVEIFAWFHGHTGQPDSPHQRHLRFEPDLGCVVVGMNMAIPSVARDAPHFGPHPIDRPLTSILAQWSRKDGVCVLRRWNHTSVINEDGSYTGAPLIDTHPDTSDRQSEYVIDYRAAGYELDLGDGAVFLDSRRQVGREAHLDYLYITRDVAQGRRRQTTQLLDEFGDPVFREDVDGNFWPVWDRGAGELQEIGAIELTDKARRNIRSTDGVYFSILAARGRTGRLNHTLRSPDSQRIAWEGDPSREAMRWGWQQSSGSDSFSGARAIWDGLDPDGIWRRVFEINGETGAVNALGHRVYSRGNFVGAVSQSGGVPTGAVIQRGS
ncbi:MAG: hypothetical protein JJU15_20500, partial [Pararhodobacter sp.]|nr:hypothetical protein [Pararhodobacter sp.]